MTQVEPHLFSKAVRWTSLWALLVASISLRTPTIAGEMYRWVDEQGHVHLTDTPPKPRSTLQDFKVYQPSEPNHPAAPYSLPSSEPGMARMIPTKPGGTVVVDAVLNRRLTIPMLLDTGADFTVLTQQVAKDLRLSSLDYLPKLEFKTAAGAVKLPIATLQSLRVGTAEARDVDVAIDIGGHMPLGLLGMTFLRHFKVTVDQQRGRVTFER